MAKAGERVAVLMIKSPGGNVCYGKIDEQIPQNAEGKVLVVHPDTRRSLKLGIKSGTDSERKYDLSTILRFGLTENKDNAYLSFLKASDYFAEGVINSGKLGRSFLVQQIAQEVGMC